MRSQSHPVILFIDRNGFSIYQDTLTNIPKFNFTSDLVVNLDVINKEQFTNLIATFIQINKIVPGNLAVILSDSITYTKDLVNQNSSPNSTAANIDKGLGAQNIGKDHKEEIADFLENIPFEEVLAKVIKTDKLSRIVAVNKDLVATIIDVFVSRGSTMMGIVPAFMYGQNANFTTGLTQGNASMVINETEIFRIGNLLTDQEKMISSSKLESELKDSPTGAKSDLDNEGKKPKNLRQYILIGIFVMLLVVLAVVFLNLGASQTPVDTISNPPHILPESDSLPTGEPTLTQAPITTAPLDIKSIKIKIVQSSQSDEKAVFLKDGLLKMGFVDVANEVSEVSIPEKSSVIFSQSIPADLRNNVITEIKKILPEISILENQDSNFTIDILIGKS